MLTHDLLYWFENVPLIRSCQTFTAHGRTFTVKRLNGRDVYHLYDHSITERSRFGTKQQIRADVEYVLETGHLPPPNSPRW